MFYKTRIKRHDVAESKNDNKGKSLSQNDRSISNNDLSEVRNKNSPRHITGRHSPDLITSDSMSADNSESDNKSNREYFMN